MIIKFIITCSRCLRFHRVPIDANLFELQLYDYYLSISITELKSKKIDTQFDDQSLKAIATIKEDDQESGIPTKICYFVNNNRQVEADLCQSFIQRDTWILGGCWKFKIQIFHI